MIITLPLGVRTINKTKSSLISSIYKSRYLYLLILPALVWYIVFAYTPMYGLQLAFKEFMYNKGIIGSPWVGLRNLENILGDPLFWRGFRNTLGISIGKLVFVFPIPIFLALLINELRDGIYKKTLQTVFTLPHFLSWIIISGIITNVLSSDGAINSLLAFFGIEGINFLGSSGLFRPLLYFTDIWKEAGWGTIIYLATISSIDPTLYEAATLDGANRLQKARFITLPSLQSTIVIMFILALGGVMNAGFDQIFNLYNPTVYETGDIIDTYIYRITFQSSMTDYGFSTALGLFKSLINCFLLVSTNLFVKKTYGAGLFS